MQARGPTALIWLCNMLRAMRHVRIAFNASEGAALSTPRYCCITPASRVGEPDARGVAARCEPDLAALADCDCWHMRNAQSAVHCVCPGLVPGCVQARGDAMLCIIMRTSIRF